MNPTASLTASLSPRQRAMLAEMGIRIWDKDKRPEQAGAHAATERDLAAPRPAKTGHAPAQPVIQSARPMQPAPRVAAPPPAASTPHAPELTPRPAPEVIAAMDWTALQATVTACRACALCTGRTQTVFGMGSQRADWMVIGEAPGEQEDQLGQPFVGPSGKLLDRMLAAIGVSRQAGVQTSPQPDPWPPGEAIPPGAALPGKNLRGVYIANVLKCRPPGNRNPQPEEIACCEPYLRRQVALVQPKVILAMGRFAVQSLLQTTDPIGRLRGKVHDYQGVPVIVSYHPAYLLRALSEKAKAWQDLCLALETLG
jgi:DNA polymerase